MEILVQLPSAFIESENFKELDEEQRLSFLRRLNNAKSLGETLASEVRYRAALDFTDYVEDLELDIAILQELDSARGGGLSRWLIHYSWSFLAPPQDMRRSLPEHLVWLIDYQTPLSNASIEDCKDWFQKTGLHLVNILDEFSATKSYAAALALHILIDILLVDILLFCYKLRTNPLMSR